MSDPRIAAAERLLAERGLPDAEVSAEGTEGEIAAIRLPGGPEALLAERELTKAVRALGFRFVAVDLG